MKTVVSLAEIEARKEEKRLEADVQNTKARVEGEVKKVEARELTAQQLQQEQTKREEMRRRTEQLRLQNSNEMVCTCIHMALAAHLRSPTYSLSPQLEMHLTATSNENDKKREFKKAEKEAQWEHEKEESKAQREHEKEESNAKREHEKESTADRLEATCTKSRRIL
jgi:hypothetical protein